jgi:hypothetical protein
LQKKLQKTLALNSDPVHTASAMKNQSITPTATAFRNPITRSDIRYYAVFRKPSGEKVIDSSYHGPIEAAVEAAEEDAHRYGWVLRKVTTHPASI